VLYLGPDPVEHAAASVAQARRRGMRATFVTNNASRRAAKVAAHLVELGIEASVDDVVTSAQAAVRHLTAHLPAHSLVLVLGTADLADEVSEAGFRVTRDAAGAVAVVQGLDAGTGWKDLAEACVAIRAGALWVACNADSTYPSARGPLPGNGALVQALIAATGQRPVVVGKPEPELHAASVERARAKRPLVVGDRLDTDVLGAVRAGSDSLLVMTGVTDRAHLLAAPEGMRPTYVSHDLRGLLVAHEAPVVMEGGASCGSARAWWEDGEICTRGEVDDALRAACALAWS
jgi:glycerol 3-phosphatase-2